MCRCLALDTIIQMSSCHFSFSWITRPKTLCKRTVSSQGCSWASRFKKHARGSLSFIKNKFGTSTQMEIDSGTSWFFLGLGGPSDPITSTGIYSSIFWHTESHLNRKNGTSYTLHQVIFMQSRRHGDHYRHFCWEIYQVSIIFLSSSYSRVNNYKANISFYLIYVVCLMLLRRSKNRSLFLLYCK